MGTLFDTILQMKKLRPRRLRNLPKNAQLLNSGGPAPKSIL